MIFISLVFLNAFLTLYLSNWFLAPFFAVILGMNSAIKGIKCPNCGTPVTFQGRIFGFAVHAGLIKHECQNCGWNLDSNESGDIKS